MNRAIFPFHLICYHFNFNFDLNSSPPFDLWVFISVVDKREQKENKYANSNKKTAEIFTKIYQFVRSKYLGILERKRTS